MAGLSARGQQLQSLAGQMPVANAGIAQGLQQARQAQLQQQIAGAAPTAGAAAAQQIGAQQAAQAGQIKLQAAQQTQQQTQQVAATAINQQRLEGMQALAAKKLGIDQRQRELSTKLSTLNRDVKNKLFDQNLSFQKDELGRTVFNERQLMDYKLANAQSDEEFKDYEQQTHELSDRKMKMLQMSYQKIQQSLQQAEGMREQQLSNEQKARLTQALQALQQKMAKEKAEQANRASMFNSVGTIAGAVVGGYFGGSSGAAAGAAVGGGAGNIAAGQTAK
jgi:hypothetical protein